MKMQTVTTVRSKKTVRVVVVVVIVTLVVQVVVVVAAIVVAAVVATTKMVIPILINLPVVQTRRAKKMKRVVMCRGTVKWMTWRAAQ